MRVLRIRKVSLKAIVLFLISTVMALAGCNRTDVPKKGSPIAGRYTGKGSYFEVFWPRYPRVNMAWTADFVRRTDSTFVGTMISTFADSTSSVPGFSMQWGVKGAVIAAPFVTIAETSMVRPTSPNWLFGDQQLINSFDSCIVSDNGDTIFYQGLPPASETFTLVRRK